jgi:membrane protease YdiL (CAAX protease family)
VTRLARFVDRTLVSPLPGEHREPDRLFRRRRIVVAATLVVGAVLLALSLATAPGDAAFSVLTLALAATWAAGAWLSGPLHLGRIRSSGGPRPPVTEPILVGLAAVAVFAVGAVVVAQMPPLRSSVEAVLAHARDGSLALVALLTVLNGLAEELFFRGAVYAAIGERHPVAISTAVYALTTVVTGNVMLVFAATVLGLLAGLERRVTGGVLAPMLTHVTWSTGMLFVLPPLMAALA